MTLSFSTLRGWNETFVLNSIFKKMVIDKLHSGKGGWHLRHWSECHIWAGEPRPVAADASSRIVIGTKRLFDIWIDTDKKSIDIKAVSRRLYINCNKFTTTVVKWWKCCWRDSRRNQCHTKWFQFSIVIGFWKKLKLKICKLQFGNFVFLLHSKLFSSLPLGQSGWLSHSRRRGRQMPLAEDELLTSRHLKVPSGHE